MWNWRNQASDRRALGNYLASSLTATPEQASQTWQQLAEIHRQAGNRAEFEILTRRLQESCGMMPTSLKTQQ